MAPTKEQLDERMQDLKTELKKNRLEIADIEAKLKEAPNAILEPQLETKKKYEAQMQGSLDALERQAADMI